MVKATPPWKGVKRMRKTKIVCTLGPATDDEAILRKLILSGMNVARLNMSHGTHEEHKRRADMVKKLRDELDVPVAILLDTKGPEIRTGQFEKKVMLAYGQKYTLSALDRPGDAEGCSITFKDLPKDVNIGTHILIDDGLIEMVVEHVTDTDIECRVLNGGPITSYKGINVPGVTLSMPYISERDRADLAFCVQEDFDFIAASFTRASEDIVMIRNELENHNCRNIRIIAKIENTDGIDHVLSLLHFRGFMTGESAVWTYYDGNEQYYLAEDSLQRILCMDVSEDTAENDIEMILPLLTEWNPSGEQSMEDWLTENHCAWEWNDDDSQYTITAGNWEGTLFDDDDKLSLCRYVGNPDDYYLELNSRLIEMGYTKNEETTKRLSTKVPQDTEASCVYKKGEDEIWVSCDFSMHYLQIYL